MAKTKAKTKQVEDFWQNRITQYGEQPADQFLPHELNARRHPGNQRDALRGSLNAVGWVAPVIVSARSGKILDGHARVEEALSKDEHGLVPFVEVDVSENEERTILATFDPITGLATYEREALDALLREVDTGDAALQAMLSELAAKEGLYLDQIKEVESAGGDDYDAEVNEDVEPIARLGDTWQLGKHFIACIDATDKGAVQKLCNDVQVQMVWSDPPYGIEIVATNGYVGGGEAYDIPFGGVKNRKGDVGGSTSHIRKTGMTYMESNKLKGFGTTNGSKPFGSKAVRGTDGSSNVVGAGKYYPVIGDDSTETAIKSYHLAASLFPDAVQVWWGGNYYADALPSSSCWLVWDKENTGHFADCELAWTNQPTAVRLFRHQWNGMIKDSERGIRRIHPTQKPVALAVWAFEKYGKENDVIFDPFLGSGISVIAAERTQRQVIGCELSPHYIDAICKRWEAETGNKAELKDRIDG
jgi:hypothetical protein